MGQEFYESGMLDAYIEDISKYPLLTQDEEDVIISEIEKKGDLFFRLLLAFPKSWSRLVEMWETIKQEGRSSSRLSAAYGSANSKADDLAEVIDRKLRAVKIMSKAPRKTFIAYDNVVAWLKEANLHQSIYFDVHDKMPRRMDDFIPVTKLEPLAMLDELRSDINNLRGKLVTANLRLVVSFVYKFRGTEVPIMDLIQEGNLGLIRAAEKFSSSKNVKFSTYASWWIRQGVIKALRLHNKSIRLPPHIFDQINKVSKAHDDLLRSLNREPSIAEISANTGFRRSRVTYLLDLSAAMPASLDVLTSEKDLLPEEGPLPDELVENIKLGENLREALEDCLTPEEETVIIRRYGLDGRVWTLNEIGDSIGISREKARLLEEAALIKMRNKAAFLKEYLS